MATSIDEFMKTATDEQRNLLFALASASEEEHKYAEEINRVHSSIKRGVYSQDGFSITLCEDEDDAQVISTGSRQKLEKVREQMKGYMRQAVELNLGHLGIIARNYQHYVGEPLPTK